MEKKVLLVDDEEMLRNFIARFLKRKGFEVIEAGGGLEALRLLDDQSFDIIVSDVRMPEGDGVFLITEVKKKLDPMPPFIFISGFADADLDELSDLGAIKILSKPIDKKALLAEVTSLVQ